MVYLSERTKATDISPKVRQEVYQRDSWDGRTCCIKCGSPYSLQVAHFIGRGQGGLGIKENLVVLCVKCHQMYDQSDQMNEMKEFIKTYLDNYYPNFTDDERKFKK